MSSTGLIGTDPGVSGLATSNILRGQPGHLNDIFGLGPNSNNLDVSIHAWMDPHHPSKKSFERRMVIIHDQHHYASGQVDPLMSSLYPVVQVGQILLGLSGLDHTH